MIAAAAGASCAGYARAGISPSIYPATLDERPSQILVSREIFFQKQEKDVLASPSQPFPAEEQTQNCSAQTASGGIINYIQPERDEILVIDIETTDFLNRGGLIVEIGVVGLDMITGKIRLILNERVKEEGFCKAHKDSWIFENSDLKFADVENAKPLNKNYLEQLFTMFRCTAWNSTFDFGFFYNRGIRVNELPCPMKISAGFFQIPGPFDWKWASVEEAWRILFPNKKYKEKHRGYDDAAHEAKIIYELYKKGVYRF